MELLKLLICITGHHVKSQELMAHSLEEYKLGGSRAPTAQAAQKFRVGTN